MASPRIAVFDLDVTLTRYDTYLPFLVGYVRRRPHRAIPVAMLPLHLLAWWRWQHRTWIKTRFLKSFVGGEPRRRLEAWATDFARHTVESGLRSSGVARLREHQDAGDRVILASASFDIYVSKIAELLDINEVIASHIQWDADDRVAGIAGENCRDAEKLRRVKMALGEPADGVGVTAYSDSHADLPLLGWAESGVAVWPSRKLSDQVASLGLDVQNW